MRNEEFGVRNSEFGIEAVGATLAVARPGPPRIPVKARRGGNLPPAVLPPLTGEAASGVPRKPDDGGVSTADPGSTL